MDERYRLVAIKMLTYATSAVSGDLLVSIAGNAQARGVSEVKRRSNNLSGSQGSKDVYLGKVEIVNEQISVKVTFMSSVTGFTFNRLMLVPVGGVC